MCLPLSWDGRRENSVDIKDRIEMSQERDESRERWARRDISVSEKYEYKREIWMEDRIIFG